MISREDYRSAVERTVELLDHAGIVITADEKARIEVADFGLNELEKTGLEIITYVNTDRAAPKRS